MHLVFLFKFGKFKCDCCVTLLYQRRPGACFDCRCALHCLARCLYMSTCNKYALRHLHFTPAQQCDFTVRYDSFSHLQYRNALQMLHLLIANCLVLSYVLLSVYIVLFFFYSISSYLYVICYIYCLNLLYLLFELSLLYICVCVFYNV